MSRVNGANDQSYSSAYSSDDLSNDRGIRNGGTRIVGGAAHNMFEHRSEDVRRQRTIFQKLGYKGYDKGEQPPDEIFQLLWLIQQNEQGLFLKNAKDYVQTKVLDRPKRRLDAMIDLRNELLAMCDNFYDEVKKVTDRIMSEMHDPQEDAGLLEIDMNKYMKCFSVDLAALDSLFCEEIKIKKEDLEDSKKAGTDLVQQMQSVLNQNEGHLKTFLEDSKFQVDQLAQSEGQRDVLKKEDFKGKKMPLQGLSLIETNLQAKKGAAKEGMGMFMQGASRNQVVGFMDQSFDEPKPGSAWKPRLRKTNLVGKASHNGTSFEWPTAKDVGRLPQDHVIKLNGFGFKANTNLYQLKFVFTSGVSSETFNSQQGTSLDHKIVPISTLKVIRAVEVNVHQEHSAIYGIRFLDSNENKMAEKQWRRSTQASWVQIEVPDDYEIIGFHGQHDGSYIKSLGLILWKPNPRAQSELNQ